MTDIVLLIVGALLSFIGGVVIARAYANKSSVSYFAKSRYVLRPLGQAIPLEIEIFHEKNKISNLVETKIGVWNSGTIGFKAQDVSQSDPICFNFTGAKVLKIVGPKDSRKALNTELSTCGDTSVRLKFEMLDKRDAFVFVVYSAVEGDEEANFRELAQMEGALSGLPAGFSRIRKILDVKKLSWKILSLLIAFGIFSLTAFIRFILAFTPYERLFYFDPIDVGAASGMSVATLGILISGSFATGAAFILVSTIKGWRERPPSFVYDELLDGL